MSSLSSYLLILLLSVLQLALSADASDGMGETEFKYRFEPRGQYQYEGKCYKMGSSDEVPCDHEWIIPFVATLSVLIVLLVFGVLVACCRDHRKERRTLDKRRHKSTHVVPSPTEYTMAYTSRGSAVPSTSAESTGTLLPESTEIPLSESTETPPSKFTGSLRLFKRYLKTLVHRKKEDAAWEDTEAVEEKYLDP